MVKDTLREIRKKWFQFFAIIIIICLGVGFFIGIQVSGYDMRMTMNQYVDETSMPNLVVLSTSGIDKEMIQELETLTESNIEGIYQGDALVLSPEGNSHEVMSFYNYNQTKSDITLTQGELPSKPGEILLDNELTNYKIGDTLIVEGNDYLKEQEVKVVGFGKSILYLNMERGSSQLGTGQVLGFGYIYDLEVKDDMYSTLRIYSDEDITTLVNTIENQENELITNRFNRLIEPEKEKLEEAQKEIDEGKLDLIQAQSDIDQGYIDLENGQNKINANRNLIVQEKENGLKKIEDARIELQKGEGTISEALEKFNEGPLEGDLRSQYSHTKQKFDLKVKVARDAFASTQLEIDQIEDETIRNQAQLELDATIAAFDIEIAYGSQALNNIYTSILEIEAGYQELDKATVILEEEINKGLSSLDDAQNTINQSKNDLVDAQNKVDTGYIDLESAQKKVDKGYRDIEKASRGELILQERKTFAIGFQSFYDDSLRIEGIGQVFPLIFFGVAILVTLSTITRMVDESRSQIGIYKALGYSWLQASTKFIGFTFFSWIIGSALGMFMGFVFIPDIIYNAYRLMYQTPDMVGGFVFSYAWLPLLVSFLSSVGIAIYKSFTISRTNAANLMRPPVPKGGQRLFLENIKFIWNKMTFLYKVSLRNLFRNKVRMLMTIVGIGGCTGLLIVGFGLDNSISGVIDKQFVELSNYNSIIVYEDDLEIIPEIEEGYSFYVERISTPITNDVSLYAIEDFTIFEKYITLQDRLSKEKLNTDKNTVIATEKLAQLNDWHVGDTITLTINTKEYEFVLTGISEHYVAHYIYLDIDLLETTVGKTLPNNMRIFQTDENKQELFIKLLKQDTVLQVTDMDERIEAQAEALGSFDIVVWIITIAAFSLELIVLLNLITMNMSERYKELATLKVLGFYPKELASYLLRENIILTFISVILGSIFGYYLHQYVILSAEVDLIMFNREISIWSYLLAGGLTLSISIIINIFMARKANKVNMSEALKTFDD